MGNKTYRSLNLEYRRRVHDMCAAYNKQHGTNIKPQQCVKFGGELWQLDDHPLFLEEPSSYDLAVSIMENTPVFVGDLVYYKPTGSTTVVTSYAPEIAPDNWTLTPPKRTFDLNGQQLPCPVRANITSTMIELRIAGNCFHFNSVEDRNKVALAIVCMLDDARDRS